MTLGQTWRVLRAAVVGYFNDRAMTMGAAIAFYTVFSLAPVLVIAIAMAGFIFGHEAAQGAVVAELGGLLGPEGAAALQELIQSAVRKGSGVVATIVGVLTFLLAATGVFAELQSSLNVIWRAPPVQGSEVWYMVRSRIVSLTMIFGLGFLLLVSLVIDAGLTAFGNYLDREFSGLQFILSLLNTVTSIAITTLLFAMIYKVLPDISIAWRDVGMGALIGALLFALGKFLISFYIGSADLASSYGAAGALIVVLVWVYYSSQILLFGAEFARAYSQRYGTHVGAERRSGQDRRHNAAEFRP